MQSGLFVGTVKSKKEGNFVMESSDGICDIFIPADICSEHFKLNIGDEATVEAVESKTGLNKWNAIQIIHRSSPQLEHQLSNEYQTFTGRVASQYGCGFLMESSSSEIGNIFIPTCVCAHQDTVLQAGDELTVDAVRSKGGWGEWDAVRIVSKSESKQTAELGCAPAQFTGKIISISKHGNFFMESAPGVCDIFVPGSVCLEWPDTIRVGNDVTVEVMPNKVGRNNWRATRVVPAIPSEPKTMDCAGKLARQINQTADRPREIPVPAEISLCRGVALKVGDEVDAESEESGSGDTVLQAAQCRNRTPSAVASPYLLSGKLMNIDRGNCFMESSPGVCDIFVPASICSAYSKGGTMRLGDDILVEAVENSAWRNRWRAVRVLHHVGKASGTSSDGLCARLFLGRIVKCCSRGCFMESSAGVCDVYVPANLKLPGSAAGQGGRLGSASESLCVGETAAVEAVLCQVGQNNWRATRVVYQSKGCGGEPRAGGFKAAAMRPLPRCPARREGR